MGGLLVALVVALASPDAVVARAVALLGADAPTVPIVIVHPPHALRGNPQTATAWTDGRTIFVNDHSEPFKRAAKGDVIALAAALAHEQYHVDHGPAEGPAYACQLAVLRALGARPGDVRDVERAAHVNR